MRPGAFIETVTQFGGDPFARGRLLYVGSKRAPFTFVRTADLAGYLARAVDAPGVDGPTMLSIAWRTDVDSAVVSDFVETAKAVASLSPILTPGYPTDSPTNKRAPPNLAHGNQIHTCDKPSNPASIQIRDETSSSGHLVIET